MAAHQTSILLPLHTVRQIDLANNSQPAFDDLLGDLLRFAFVDHTGLLDFLFLFQNIGGEGR